MEVQILFRAFNVCELMKIYPAQTFFPPPTLACLALMMLMMMTWREKERGEGDLMSEKLPVPHKLSQFVASQGRGK